MLIIHFSSKLIQYFLKFYSSNKKIKLVLLSNRFKSFYWRSGAMLVVGFLNVILESATDLQLSNITVIVLGLIVAVITKVLNSSK